MSLSRIAVFGDSLLWGQGLRPEQKMTSLANQTLASGTAECIMLAHSGAVIGEGLNPPRSPFPSDIFREVPQPYPTIHQQAEDLTNRPDTIDLVLINGGSNDVGFTYILNPLTDLEELKTLTHLFFHQHLARLLRAVAARCPNAKIIVVGQYPVLSRWSEIGLVDLFLRGLFVHPGGTGGLNDLFAALGLTQLSVKDRVVDLSILFWRESNLAIQAAVNELGSPRIKMAIAPVTEEHAALTQDPWLWGLTHLLEPQDPMEQARRVPCDQSTQNPFRRFACHRASAGHPNVEGARRFAKVIVDTFQSF